MGGDNWTPSRTTPHPARQAIATGAHYEFAMPAGANGFLLGADNKFTITLDGTIATATNGFYIDPTAPGSGGGGAMFPITPRGGQISVFNAHTATINVAVAWLEDISE